MAGLSIDGKKGARRSLDSEINMIPMIDLLMVTISFLLITAVWSHYSRMEATAKVPSSVAPTPPCDEGGCKEDQTLHVMTHDPAKFVLVWKQGATVMRSVDVPKENKGKYSQLAAKVNDEWRASGAHRDATDRSFDKAVVHSSNDLPYGELIAVMDAVAKPKRPYAAGGKTVETSAFALTFAMD
jgi:biopolymer transport protein ExbD